VKATYPITNGSLEGTAKYYDENGNISWQVYETNRPNLQNKIDLSGWCLN
jgi:antitoxin component YwqK of YwqJK toxin-antitoxin module